MSTTIMDEAAKLLADPMAYTDQRRLHAALAHLRASAPVSWVEVPDYRPFWAITKHADIMDIERENMLFTNWPRPVLTTAEGDEMQAAAGPECDFVQQVAVNYPLYVIMSLLGLPEADFPRMLKLTQELFGSDDSEFKRGTTNEDQLPALFDMFTYFNGVTEARREHPTEDLASAIANARVDGEPLSDIDTVSYYLIVATAGHDTTSATISGGLHALIENPDQLARLRDNLELMPLATEEMIRWVTPVKEFMRTAAEDTSVRGVPIAAGDSVLLSYVSANRDEEVFADPFRFDVGRDPNKHLAFGYGVHFCMGAALARMEVNSFFTELLPRLKSVELNGEPELVATTFVGGLKHLPVRYTLA